MYTKKKQIETAVNGLVVLRTKRLTKPPLDFIFNDGKVYTDEQHTYIVKHRIFLEEQTKEAEREYIRKPKENIPDLKLFDYSQHYSDWRNLPRLLTV